MFMTQRAGMTSYSKQINKQRTFFSIKVKLTNTLLLPVNKNWCKKYSMVNIMASAGGRIISSLVAHYHDAGTCFLRMSPWLFSCSLRKLTGVLVQDLAKAMPIQPPAPQGRVGSPRKVPNPHMGFESMGPSASENSLISQSTVLLNYSCFHLLYYLTPFNKIIQQGPVYSMLNKCSTHI